MASPANIRFMLYGLNIVLLCLLGVVDYVTGYELNFFAFYYIPIALSAWYSRSFFLTFLFCVLAGVIWFVVDYYSCHWYSHVLLGYWNTLIRLFSFCFIGGALLRIRNMREYERELLSDQKKTIERLESIQDFLTLCPSCGRIKNESGQWQTLEEYRAKHAQLKRTPEKCPDCTRVAS
jgi:hypothetical protein